MPEAGFAIREARPDDAAAVCALWTEAFMTGEPGAVREPYAVEDFTDTVEVATVFVAEIGGGLAGCISLFDSDHPGINRPGEAEISRLAVASSARRTGIARELMRRCHEAAGSRGDRAIVLWSGPHQTAGHGLYESLGYLRDAERDVTLRDGRAAIIFSLELR
jgi:ribosomal protein S18 acetylase RimI-like enzyme